MAPQNEMKLRSTAVKTSDIFIEIDKGSTILFAVWLDNKIQKRQPAVVSNEHSTDQLELIRLDCR